MSYNTMSKFYHNLFMQALSKSGHKETVDFIKNHWFSNKYQQLSLK